MACSSPVVSVRGWIRTRYYYIIGEGGPHSPAYLPRLLGTGWLGIGQGTDSLRLVPHPNVRWNPSNCFAPLVSCPLCLRCPYGRESWRPIRNPSLSRTPAVPSLGSRLPCYIIPIARSSELPLVALPGNIPHLARALPVQNSRRFSRWHSRARTTRHHGRPPARLLIPPELQ